MSDGGTYEVKNCTDECDGIGVGNGVASCGCADGASAVGKEGRAWFHIAGALAGMGDFVFSGSSFFHSFFAHCAFNLGGTPFALQIARLGVGASGGIDAPRLEPFPFPAFGRKDVGAKPSGMRMLSNMLWPGGSCVICISKSISSWSPLSGISPLSMRTMSVCCGGDLSGCAEDEVPASAIDGTASMSSPLSLRLSELRTSFCPASKLSIWKVDAEEFNCGISSTCDCSPLWSASRSVPFTISSVGERSSGSSPSSPLMMEEMSSKWSISSGSSLSSRTNKERSSEG
mmetsp:Transcript_43015/g.86206  ORF Transcript_43015/g.86206 Transcript_43015/m.86206 type:complete len:287 (-) Transcript_43015:433-1293(-)